VNFLLEIPENLTAGMLRRPEVGQSVAPEMTLASIVTGSELWCGSLNVAKKVETNCR
jgi:hypothetical protein